MNGHTKNDTRIFYGVKNLKEGNTGYPKIKETSHNYYKIFANKNEVKLKIQS